MRIIVTGGAGFVGSHLVDALLSQGHHVICVDRFFSGKKENIAHHLTNPNFTLVTHDVRKRLKNKFGPVDRIYHLACPASPDQYQFDPVLTLETSVVGTKNLLEFARETSARLLFTSTSEVYGDPLEHPQKESYWGNVDQLGKRACYDEGKRAGETLCKDYRVQYGVDSRIVRLFNTYGPRMMFHDGRSVSNFILQALLGEDITVHGDGMQTRSFMYVSDLISALIKRMELAADDGAPMNLGNPDERHVGAVAELIKQKTHSASTIVYLPIASVPERLGDPKQRCPDITHAKTLLGWQPSVSLEQGLEQTIVDFRKRLSYRPRVLVWSTAYLPFEGPAEHATSEIIQRLPEWEFDIVTARLDKKLPEEVHHDRVHIYRIGNGTMFDKILFPFRAAVFARLLHKKNQYQVSWAIMASYGALAATLFSTVFRSRVPFLLSVYEGSIDEKMVKRGKWLSPLYERIFRQAHRWQVVGAMTPSQQRWLESERQVQAVQLDGNWPLLAKRTKELLQEVEILATRL